jgi:hypothetical protein
MGSFRKKLRGHGAIPKRGHRFGRDGVVELTHQIALENLRSRMNSALGITEQGFNSGDACRVPWADAEATRKARRR